MQFPLSLAEQSHFFMQWQYSFPALPFDGAVLSSWMLQTEKQDPTTYILLLLLQGREEEARMATATYFAQYPKEAHLLNLALPFILKHYPRNCSSWLTFAPDQPLSDVVLRSLFQKKEQMENPETFSVGFLRSKNPLFWKQALWGGFARFGLFPKIICPKLWGPGVGFAPFFQEMLPFSPDFLWIYLDPEDLLPYHEWIHKPARLVEMVISSIEQILKNSTTEILLSTFLPWVNTFQKEEILHPYRYLNYQLVEAFSKHPRVSLLDMDLLFQKEGTQNSLDWFRSFYALAPESSSFLGRVSRRVTEWIRQQCGQLRKCVVLDLDGTLWGGSLDEGQISIAPEYPGNMYYQFQRALKELLSLGFVFAINTQNDRAQVLHALKHTEHLLLREEDFVWIEADWSEKPEKMQRLQKALHLSLDSFIFIDNDPRERFLMRQVLPQILTPEWPEEEFRFLEALREIPELTRFQITLEDSKRTQNYQQEWRRQESEKQFLQREDFLQKLGLTVSLNLASSEDYERLAQLSKRVNQFHLTGKRFLVEELRIAQESPTQELWKIEAGDVFGSYGCVGMLLTKQQKDSFLIQEFFLSCRVLNRGIEDAILSWGTQTQMGLLPCWIQLFSTPQNLQAQAWIARLKTKPTLFSQTLELIDIPSCPPWILRGTYDR